MGFYEGAELSYRYTGSRTQGSVRVQSSLTVTQGVGHGFYEGVELSEVLDVEHVLGVRFAGESAHHQTVTSLVQASSDGDDDRVDTCKT